jgi:nucleoside-diphosphate-sugar epimerase
LYTRRSTTTSPPPAPKVSRFPHHLPAVSNATGLTYAVTGGNGLVGSHLVEGLLERGERKIRIVDASKPSSLFAQEMKEGSVTMHTVNICDEAAVCAALEGVDVVFHIAAIVDYWSYLPGENPLLQKVNFGGTQNVVKACKANGVQKLLFCSSSSVVLRDDIMEKPMLEADESLPYPTAPFLCHYVQSKADAEKLVLESNNTKGKGKGVYTAALRPGGIWGPRDLLIGRTWIEKIPGVGIRDAATSYTYVANLVYGFFLLEQHVGDKGKANGQAYFCIDRDCNIKYYDFYNGFYSMFNMGNFQVIPQFIVSGLVYFSEFMYRYGPSFLDIGELKQLRVPVLKMTRGTWTCSNDKIEKELGYKQVVSREEGYKNVYIYHEMCK